MKAQHLLLICALNTVIFSACEKKPSACFSTSALPTIHHEVTFTNCTTEGSTYEWDFGDGGTSTLTAPTHTYSTAGTFTVNMKAFSKNGKKTSETSQEIVVCGNAAFQWASSSNLITVHVGSDTKSGYPNTIYSDCESQITYWLPVGTYSYTASEQSPGTHTWSGTFTITAQGCTDVYLQ